jgi:hypothetical protein
MSEEERRDFMAMANERFAPFISMPYHEQLSSQPFPSFLHDLWIFCIHIVF